MAKIRITPRQVQRAAAAVPVINPSIAGLSEGAKADAGATLSRDLLAFTSELHNAEVQADVTNRIATAQTEFNTFYTERASDPNKYKTLQDDTDKAVGELRSRTFDGVTDGRAQDLLSMRFAQLERDAKVRAGNDSRRQQINYIQKQTENTLEQNALNAGGANDRDRQLLQKDTEALLAAQVSSGVLTRPAADDMLQKYRTSVQVQHFEKLINDNPEQALQILDGRDAIDDIDEGTRNALRRSARSEVNQLKAARSTVVTNMVKDAVWSIEHGYLPANFAEVQAAAKDVPGALDVLNLKYQQYQAISDLAALPPTQRRQWIDAQRSKDNLTRPAIEVLEQVEKIHSKQQALVNQDPLRLGVEKGLIPNQPPLAFDNPQVLAEQLAGRRAASAVVTQHIGEPASPLYAEEYDELKRMLYTGDVSMQTGLLGSIVAGLGDEAGGFLSQLNKDGARTWAAMGGLLLQGDGVTANQLGIGRKTLDADSKAGPKEADFRAEVLVALGDAYSSLPVTEANMIKTARELYVGLGGDAEAVDQDTLQTAINRLTGGIVRYDPPGLGNSQRLPAPAPGVTEDAFNGWLSHLNEQDVERYGGVSGFEPGQVIRWIQAEDGARLVNVGQGLYAIELPGVTGQMELLRSANNPAEPFLIDWENRPAPKVSNTGRIKR